jgi:transketolase N-terminal domain/subunit/transketolase C-terminal domain/subunit
MTTDIAEYLKERGFLKLLEIKDSDIRIATLRQGADSVDKGIHIGGAFSAVIPLVSLYYGGMMRVNVESPTQEGQDRFVLSKGHAVAAMASIFADLGYLEHATLKNSRSLDSILNGHPGPLLPGVHLSTGPMGQGLGVAQGFALIGKGAPNFDVYCLTGDGEMQEGTIWEAIMYSGAKRLENLCVIIDKNEGQLDNSKQLHFDMSNLAEQLAAFGWRVYNIDGTQYSTLWHRLKEFRFLPRDGRPTAIVANTRKGFGGFSNFMSGHKVELPPRLVDQEITLQNQRRAKRVSEFLSILDECHGKAPGDLVRQYLMDAAGSMNLKIDPGNEPSIGVASCTARIQPAIPRQKKIEYAREELPSIDPIKLHSAAAVVTAAMMIFARDRRVVSIDADLGTTSGLQEGVGHVDNSRALNVGVAEANMMCIGEAYAAMGYNVWVSTFCPFFNYNVLRRIAISHQERLEVMASDHGWLSAGHGLDLVFLATAPDFETRTNGATHMGNDDLLFFKEIAHLKIVSLSCPNQVLAFMRWVMEGSRGLVYARILRSPSAVLYGQGIEFDYGRGYWLMHGDRDEAYIVSSGRGAHEALVAGRLLSQEGIAVGVVDLPSFDEALMLNLYDSQKPVLVAEQNNGYIWRQLQSLLFRERQDIDTRRLLAVNTLSKDGSSRFIHSGTYEQLLGAFGLSPRQIAGTVKAFMRT